MDDGKFQFEISAENSRLRIDEVQKFLSKASWCQDITVNEIRKAVKHSALTVGAYLPDGRQIGFLRVASDKVRFAYFMDVVVDESFRKRGIARSMVKYAMNHPEMKDVYQWVLKTDDAHGVYAACGFEPLKRTEQWMGAISPRPDRRNFEG